ncbi:MAG: hypothetical protein OSJ63_05550 [Bacilli bacterium]|nr:hypothetical protein [Bacilli bacterium]
MKKIMIVFKTNDKGDVDIILSQTKNKATKEETNVHNYLLNFITDKIKELTNNDFQINKNLLNNVIEGNEEN